MPARRRFGQHFLAATWAERVLAQVAPAPGDVFLEIGPGRGALTLPLARTGVPILAVEIDRGLAAGLAPRVPPNVTVLTADVLSVDVLPYLAGLQPQQVVSQAGAGNPGSKDPGLRTEDPGLRSEAPGLRTARRLRVAGNLPYNISSPILYWLVERAARDAVFTDATIMLQREVVDRLVARPGTKAYGALGILVQRHATITRLLDLPPGAFTPAPRVRSSVVRLVFHPASPPVPDDARFEAMIKALLSHRRKMLSNAIKSVAPNGAEVLVRSGLDGRRRPETLTLDELARLAVLFAATATAAGTS